MPNRTSHIRRLAGLALIATAGVAQACGSATTDAGGSQPDASFTLTRGATTLSLPPAGTLSTFIKATRTTGFTGAITYQVTGAPTGLTVTLANTTVADSSTLTVSAAGTLAPANYPVSIDATAPGAIAQHAELTVTVTPPGNGGPAIKLLATGVHTCALAATGAAYCWGLDVDGQLGNDETSQINPRPVRVAGVLTFQSLAVSKVDAVSCGLTTDGAAYCWGRNVDGQLGDGTTTRRLSPTRVAGGLTFKTLAVGYEHSCGLTTNGVAYCWGESTGGAFGDGTSGVHVAPSVAAPGMTFDSIVAGGDYTCALTAAGAGYCWGRGQSGQLGNGLTASSTTPVAVSGGLTFRSLTAGGMTVCGLTAAGKAYCWGHDFYGSIGDGSSGTTDGVTRRVVPTAVAGGLTFKSLSAGYLTTCGVTDAGAGYCWGYNFGAVGDGGGSDHRAVPTAVSGGLVFQSISSGTALSCGVTVGNVAYCWGDNANGALGDGTTVARGTAMPVGWQ
ncbi:MAG TPA: hypothetical protein VK636_17475 [Gemmatimonadaceae bacterium]|nr:hypothetical protein [Gemmatimonadaceae bacterium]